MYIMKYFLPVVTEYNSNLVLYGHTFSSGDIKKSFVKMCIFVTWDKYFKGSSICLEQ